MDNQNRNSERKGNGKTQFRPNKEGMTALIILILIVAICIALLVLTIKAISGAVKNRKETTAVTTTEATTVAPEPVKTWHDGYIKETVSSGDTEKGSLILVNPEHKYEMADKISSKLLSLYGTTGYGSYFVLHDSSVKVHRDMANALRQMIADLVDANPTLGKTKAEDRVIISSGYRSVEYQQGLYNKQSQIQYVAVPGHSEHHTGLAVDLKVFTSEGKTVDFRPEEQAWLAENCKDYGFVIRYDGAKSDITGILNESWHFRYVGIPHAKYMTEHNLCLEEYLELLKTEYTYDKGPLTYQADGSEYIIYSFPASADATTFVPVPMSERVESVEISGDNMGGFIVTVTKK